MIKNLLGCLLFWVSFNAYSTVIVSDSFGGFELDNSSQIVTDANSNLEWLNWTVTAGQSIDDALAGVANTFDGGGWELANETQMASLLTSFGFGSFSANGNTFALTPFEFGDTSSDFLHRQFLNIFGSLRTVSSNTGDGRLRAQALYRNSDSNSPYVSIEIFDDFQTRTLNGLFEAGALVEFQKSRFGTSFSNQYLGIALVRDTTNNNLTNVSEPSVFALMSILLIVFFTKRHFNQI